MVPHLKRRLSPLSSQPSNKPPWSGILHHHDQNQNHHPSTGENSIESDNLPRISAHDAMTTTTSMNQLVSTLGPVSLLGGTSLIYSSLLKHPSSTLTPLSLLFMGLLALQYAIQPRLSKKYIAASADKQSVALVEEVVKTTMAAVIFWTKPKDTIQAELQDWSLASSLTVAGLPAVLYALQGVLQYVSHQHLDAVTFNGLTQTKTLSAALCCWIILHKSQSPVQMVALTILFASALVFQGNIRLSMMIRPSIKSSNKQHGDNDINNKKDNKKERKKPIAKVSVVEKEEWFVLGVLPCMGAAFLSGLAGALSQKGLQLTGIRGRDPFLYTVEISFYSAVALLLNMTMTTRMRKGVSTPKSFFVHQLWNYKTMLPIVVKAAGGVITALVHKYAGSVAKGFALMFGLVLSGTLQMYLSQESMQPHQLLGTLMIMLSTWLHFTHPSTSK